MIYDIMNRLDAKHSTYQQEAPATAIISITDYGDAKNQFYPQAWLKGLLELQFNDTNEGGWRCISPEQAAEIAAFAHKMHSQVERIIVHCEYGQSRSAGVAAAIREYFEGDDGGIFKNSKYLPNMTCYRLVMAALKKEGSS